MLTFGFRLNHMVIYSQSQGAFTLWYNRPELPTRAIIGQCEQVGRADGPMLLVALMSW